MVAQYILEKKDFRGFMKEIIKEFELIAPVRGDETKQNSRSMFRKIDNPDDIWLEKLTYFPVKYYFFSKKEVILEFDGNKIIDPVIKIGPRVFFGLRRCDLNGIYHQDMVFLNDNPDSFYKARRENAVLIGLHCKKGDEFCFCNSVGLIDFYDIMFYDKGEFYAIEIGSKKGEGFISKYSEFLRAEDNIITMDDRKIINHKILNDDNISELYERDEWKTGSDKCLSCGACNLLCPNCHCYSVFDEVNFDLKTGRRVRIPTSCQVRSFTRVAGDHIFRRSRIARFKHRIFHHLQYFKERHGVQFCTGCGRCIRGCPANIDWVEIINKMK